LFGGGLTSQQTLITLSRWKAIIEYMLGENFSFPIVLCNVNTARKKVFGKSRIAGIKPKEYVQMSLERIFPDLHKFDKKNKRNEFDKHNYDMYDAIVMSITG